MPNSRNKVISLDRLAQRPALASVLLRLMMVINDCAIADESITIWRSEESEARRTRRQKASKYFVEIQIAHIYEGLKIIKEVKETSTASSSQSRRGSRSAPISSRTPIELTSRWPTSAPSTPTRSRTRADVRWCCCTQRK